MAGLVLEEVKRSDPFVLRAREFLYIQKCYTFRRGYFCDNVTVGFYNPVTRYTQVEQPYAIQQCPGCYSELVIYGTPYCSVDNFPARNVFRIDFALLA